MECFSRAWHAFRRTQGCRSFALIVQGVWAGVLAISGKFDQLTDLAIFAFWLFYGMVTASVFIFRWREPNVERPYRTWGYPVVPAVFVLVTIYLIVFTIYNAPRAVVPWFVHHRGGFAGLLLLFTKEPGER